MVPLPEVQTAAIFDARTGDFANPFDAMEFLRFSDIGAYMTFGAPFCEIAASAVGRAGRLTWSFMDGLAQAGQAQERRLASEYGLSLHDARLTDLGARENFSEPLCAVVKRRVTDGLEPQHAVFALLSLGLLFFAPRGESDEFRRRVNSRANLLDRQEP